MKNIHIGEIIKQKFEERQMSAADFAWKIHLPIVLYVIYLRGRALILTCC